MDPLQTDSAFQFRRVKPNSRSRTGFYITRKGKSLEFESTLELHTLLILDFEPAVDDVAVQPMRISDWVPDCLIRIQDEKILAEIKKESELIQRWPELSLRYSSLNKHCLAQGFTFGLITDALIYYPERCRVGILEAIWHLARECRHPEEETIGQIDRIIRSQGLITIRTLIDKLGPETDTETRLKAVCNSLANGIRHTLLTPSSNLLDCIVSSTATKQNQVFGKRILSFEALQERIRTHPYSHFKEGIRVVS